MVYIKVFTFPSGDMGFNFFIATQSPLLLAMRGAKIYDLDGAPVEVKRWTGLKNVRTYYEFFKEHRNEF
jgi:predicted ATPase